KHNWRSGNSAAQRRPACPIPPGDASCPRTACVRKRASDIEHVSGAHERSSGEPAETGKAIPQSGPACAVPRGDAAGRHASGARELTAHVKVVPNENQGIHVAVDTAAKRHPIESVVADNIGRNLPVIARSHEVSSHVNIASVHSDGVDPGSGG